MQGLQHVEELSPAQLLERISHDQLDEKIAKEIDLLKRTLHDQDKKITECTNLVAAIEADEELEDEDEVKAKLSDLIAKVGEMEDRRMRTDEELKTLQSRVREMRDYDEASTVLYCNIQAVFFRVGSSAMNLMHFKFEACGCLAIPYTV